MHPLEGAPNFGIPAVIATSEPDQQAIALGSTYHVFRVDRRRAEKADAG